MVILMAQGPWVAVDAAARGRVRLSATSIVSDYGTPLRGAYVNPDVTGGKIPPRETFTHIKDLGFNAVHMWLECFHENAGDYAASGDSVVKWTREEGLYCVICYGCCEKNAQFFYDKVTNFWKFYAPRYKDETKMEQDCYHIIRDAAPETHILVFSYCNIAFGPWQVTKDIQRMGPDIDWTNTSVAIHGYHPQSGTLYVPMLVDSGVPLTVTEFPANNDELIRMYEKYQISYFHFFNISVIDSYMQGVVSRGITWEPDYGDWPMPHVTATLDERRWVGPFDRRRSGSERVVAPFALGEILLKSAAGGNAVYDLQGRILRPGPPIRSLPTSAQVVVERQHRE
jgi:hypothetical protein